MLAFDGIVGVARHRIEAPGLIARFRVVGGDEAADAVFTAAVTDDDLPIDHPRCAGDGVGAILRGGLHGPIRLSRAGVESHEATVEGTDVNAALPSGHAAVHDVAAGVDAPLPRHLRVVFPEELAGAGIVGEHRGPGARGEHHAIDHDGGGF